MLIIMKKISLLFIDINPVQFQTADYTYYIHVVSLLLLIGLAALTAHSTKSRSRSCNTS